MHSPLRKFKINFLNKKQLWKIALIMNITTIIHKMTRRRKVDVIEYLNAQNKLRKEEGLK